MITMKLKFGSSIMGFSLVIFSSCIGNESIVPFQEFVAVINARPVTNARLTMD